MKKNTVYVSGLLNFETILNVEKFPIDYFPIAYPFYGINSEVSGTAFNISKALTTLGDKVILSSYVGNDLLGKTILSEAKKAKIDVSCIKTELEQTPNCVVIVDSYGETQTHTDLKNIQELQADVELEKQAIEKSDLVVLCNSNFNRPLLEVSKKLNKKIATDVHILGSIDDPYNKQFLEYGDIVFLSQKGIVDLNHEDFLIQVYNRYHNDVIVMGEGKDGAMILDGINRVVYHVDAITLVNIVNTVGSRDALFSSFIHYYLQGKQPLEALKLAGIFTSYKIGSLGGANGFLTEKEINKYAKKVDYAVYKICEF